MGQKVNPIGLDSEYDEIGVLVGMPTRMNIHLLWLKIIIFVVF